MADVASCSRCGGLQEDVLDAVRDCPKARSLWMRLVRSSFWPEFFNFDLTTWLHLNLIKKLGRLEFDWHSTFATAVWSLWRWRNEIIFGNGDEGTDWFFTFIHRVRSFRDDFESIFTQRSRPPARVNKDVVWKKPLLGWVKINVDGACNKDQSLKAACGGVARDHNGRYVGAFTRNLGACSSLHAELWGVQSGLDMALQFGLEKVVIKMDSLVACELIKSPPNDSHPCIALLRGIHGRSCDIGEVVFQHVYREGNHAADAMAAKAYNSSYLLELHNSPPVFENKDGNMQDLIFSICFIQGMADSYHHDEIRVTRPARTNRAITWDPLRTTRVKFNMDESVRKRMNSTAMAFWRMT
ncbi:putative reverse transcriptase [Senna tora]|uniref:Putative reverse transcriptase n=1 Tax=Senna tora TaxID=362788 RepID=A0A834SGC2_9FABA|nr:putative reverse transcriptase [Senna tora]